MPDQYDNLPQSARHAIDEEFQRQDDEEAFFVAEE